MYISVCEREGALMYPAGITTMKIKPVFMSSSHNNTPLEIKPQSTTTESQDSNEQIPDKIVIPDECGDSLWEEVLAQHADLTTVINKPTGTESDEVPAVLQSGTTKL
jgi:hypothetical protein